MNTELDRRDFTKLCSASTLSALTCGLSETLAAETAAPRAAKPSYLDSDTFVLSSCWNWSSIEVEK